MEFPSTTECVECGRGFMSDAFSDCLCDKCKAKQEQQAIEQYKEENK